MFNHGGSNHVLCLARKEIWMTRLICCPSQSRWERFILLHGFVKSPLLYQKMFCIRPMGLAYKPSLNKGSMQIFFSDWKKKAFWMSADYEFWMSKISGNCCCCFKKSVLFYWSCLPFHPIKYARACILHYIHHRKNIISAHTAYYQRVCWMDGIVPHPWFVFLRAIFGLRSRKRKKGGEKQQPWSQPSFSLEMHVLPIVFLVWNNLLPKDI